MPEVIQRGTHSGRSEHRRVLLVTLFRKLIEVDPLEVLAAKERDNVQVPVEKVALVKSGEILDWTITSVNEGNAPANEYKAVGKIPAGTQFIAGSAKADGSAALAYSIDNGKSFSAAPT